MSLGGVQTRSMHFIAGNIRRFNGFVATYNQQAAMSASASKLPLKWHVNRARQLTIVPDSRKARRLQVYCSSADQSRSSSTMEKVQEIISRQLSVDVATVQPDTQFSDLGADSLDTVEIVMSIEEEFGVSISEDIAEKISTVQQVADLIEQQIINVNV